MKSKKVALSGYFGFDNFGDDAILQVIVENLQAINPKPDITIFSKNPDKTSQKYGHKAVYTFDIPTVINTLRHSDILISGGGSLLQDSTSLKSLFYYLFVILSAKMLGKKVFVYAQGIGPIKSAVGRFFTKHILKMADTVTVRDEKSKKLLENWKINAVLTADPVWEMSVNSPKKVNNKTIVGIQLRQWPELDKTKLEQLAKAVISNFNTDNTEFHLIPLQDTKDTPVSKEFVEILKEHSEGANCIIHPVGDVTAVFETLNNLDCLLAMRFHAVLAGIMLNIPTFAMSYDPKVESLAIESDIPYLSIVHFTDEKLENFVKKLIHNQQELRKQLQIFSEKKRIKSRQTFELLLKLIMG